MTKEELIRRRQPILDQLTLALNEKYQLAQQYPITDSFNYEKLLHFTKGFGCKVFRNSQGIHLLKNDDTQLEKDLKKQSEATYNAE